MFLTSRMTILFILSLFLGFIAMNIKVIEQPQNELFPEPKQDFTEADNFFSRLFEAIKSSENSTNQLPIILSDIKPSVAFDDMQVKLYGIVYNGKKESYALISHSGRMQEVYQTGSLIFHKATVEEISKSQIVIKYYSESHILKMDLQGYTNTLPYLSLEKEDILQQRIVIEQDKRRNPIRLLLIRRPYAVYEEGQFLGYKIMPGGNADQFIRLGFESGDIITSLNGLTFHGPGMQQFIISELTHSRNINLVVLRGDDQLSIMYGF